MKTVLTKEMEIYFIENAFKESQKSMAAKFNVSKIVVSRVFKLHGIEVPREVSIKFRTEKALGRTSFSEMEDLFIKENYLTMPVKTIGKVLRRSFTGVMGRIKQMGLTIPNDIKEKRKSAGQYRKGQSPFNKGKKQSEYLSPEQIAKCRKTSFQPGLIPHNSLPDNSEVERFDKRSGKKYLMIKVPGLRKLIYKQVHVWENHHNKRLPKGYNIIFKNGNTMDCNIDNLECISNAELMKRNTIHRYPEYLRKAIKINSRINRALNENDHGK